MSLVFADTGYWRALIDARDELHAAAVGLSLQYREDEIITSQMVFVEVLAGFSRAKPELRRAAVSMLQYVADTSDVVVIPQTDEQFRAAMQRFAERPDQSWSLTDCASFLVMEERAIADALAYDRDFEQAGFAALLRGPGA